MAKKNSISPERKELISKLVKEFDLKSVQDIEHLFKEQQERT